jgi:putative transferase (TIGR04331 family)
VKLNFDHSYLEELYEKILIILSNKLNKEHSINNTIDFWRILIGPWLITYISVIFDRYEQLKNVNQNELSTAIINQQYIHSENYDDFITNILTDNWNFQIYFKL